MSLFSCENRCPFLLYLVFPQVTSGIPGGFGNLDHSFWVCPVAWVVGWA